MVGNDSKGDKHKEMADNARSIFEACLHFPIGFVPPAPFTKRRPCPREALTG